MSVSTTSMPGGTSPGDGTMSAGGPAPAVTGDRVAPAWAWSALLVGAAVWLAFCWTVLRVEPSDMSRWAGAAVLFGAVSEALRAISGGRMWWMNAGMAALFAATGTVIMLDRDGSLTTPAALVGWYLLVRGAVDIVTAAVSRANDSTWGLPAAIGVLEVALGFWASSSFGRTADMLVMVVGAMALARGIADLTTSLSLRSAASSAGTAVASRAVQAAGTRGYVAGMADFAAATAAGARPGRARHRATGGVTSAAAASKAEQPAAIAEADAPVGAEPAADRDGMLALAGVSGAAVGSTMQAGGMSGTGSAAAIMPSAAGAGMPGGAATPSDIVAKNTAGAGTPMSTSRVGAGASNGTSNGASAQAISLAPMGSSTTGGRPTDRTDARTAMPGVMTMGGAAGAAGAGRTGGPASGVGSAARSGASAAAEPARPATMFTAPDVVPGGEAVAMADRRVPAGPPAGMSIKGGPTNAAVQGTQTDTVRISPAAAAGVSADAAARNRDRAPGAADRGPDRAAEQGADRSAGQGPDRADDGGPGRGPDRPLGRRRAI